MEINNIILAIDSSTSVLRIGLIDGEGKITRQESRDKFRHAEHILGLIDRAMKDGRCSRQGLRGIIVSIGPGSFTGLRVGIATAKGLGVSLGIPVAGLSIYNAAAPKIIARFGPTMLLIPSRRDEFYYGLVKSGKFDDNEIKIVAASELAKMAQARKMLFLDFEPKALNLPETTIMEAGDSFISIDDFLQRGGELLADGGDDLARLEPIYVKKFPAKVSL